MRNNAEYQLCKAVATYLRLQYPKVLFHFDLAGLNLSRAQAGMMKAIQGGRGWPDLFIAYAKGGYHGLFIELKADGVKLLKKDGDYTTPHIEEQDLCISDLQYKRYYADFAIGFDDAKSIIDKYIRLE